MQARNPSITQMHRDIIDHSYRLLIYAGAIACALSLSPEEILRASLAALVHDVGKFAIPAPILLKPGPLTLEEQCIMHHHPVIGLQILSRLGGELADVGFIVAAHHEHWDGGGYPLGLTKDAIPLEARILSVADAYDAMTSPRIYRQPISPRAAREELERCSGYQFDPRVVATFLQILDVQEPCRHVHVPQDRKHNNGERLRNLSITRYLVTLAQIATLASA